MVASVVGIRRDVNPLAPAVEKAVGDALEALEQKLEEAKGQNDTVFAGYLAVMIAQIRAQKAMVDGLTATVAAAGSISDQQFAVLRQDFKRTMATAAAGWIDQILRTSKLRSWAIVFAVLAGMLIIGITAGRYWPGDPPGAPCADQADGSRVCWVRLARSR